MLREGWGVLLGHQWGPNLATSGELCMAMDTPDYQWTSIPFSPVAMSTKRPPPFDGLPPASYRY